MLVGSWAFPYESVLVAPIVSTNKERFGTLYLLRKVNYAFDSITLSIVGSFTLQAAITIQNFRLLSALVENQRFQNELQIAREIQQKLFPSLAATKAYQDFEIFAHSESAKEVGGDYYDFYKIGEKKYAAIIADVSGNGISAAFYMAQMKGIFQCLAPLNLNPDKFMLYANAALSNCLEKTSFITATYYYIDTQYQQIYLSRAGHCPSLLFEQHTQDARFLKNKGLGLGIVRNERFKDFVEVDSIKYQAGDLLTLYTDGIVEAKNETTGEQFGYERLLAHIVAHAHEPLEIIYQALIEGISTFTQSEIIDDDFTLILIRF